MSRRWGPHEDAEGRQVRHVGDALSVISGRLGLGNPTAIGAALTAWPDVVGPAIAAHTTAKGVRDQTLTVEVDAPEWTTQLRFLEADIVARLSAVVGPGVVARIHYVVRGAGPRR